MVFLVWKKEIESKEVNGRGKKKQVIQIKK